MADIAVIGAGYVGLTTAAGMASLGHSVLCADIDADRIDQLNAGSIPIFEDGMEALVRAGLDEGRLRFVVGASTASAVSEFHYLCLPTPPGADGAADLSFVLGVAAEVADVLPAGSVVINKSTVPVGTASLVADQMSRDDVSVVSNPEFLREGSAIHDFLNPDRIVIGSDNPTSSSRVAALYAGVDTIMLETDARSSELIKYASNAYLATKLTFVNEMAEVCEELGADIDAVMSGMGHDRRIGTSYLSPGPGWGGSCFPKDTEALVHIAAEVNVQFDFLRSVIELNHRHIERVAHKVRELAGGDVKGKRIAAWGLAFKAGTNDLRDSPAIAVLRLLSADGADIVAYDPAISHPPELLPEISVASSALDAAAGAQVLVLLTEWDEFSTIDFEALGTTMANRHVVDARNVLDRAQLLHHGFVAVGIGK